MLLREIIYYHMSYEQLSREIDKIDRKLSSDISVKKRIKYLRALSDIAKVIIRRNRKDAAFMLEARRMLYNLQSQANKVMEES